MTLKRKIAIRVSIIFSVVFGVAASTVYWSFAKFRKEEFLERLEEQALTTAKLLVEVNEVDKQLLKLIDRNTINKLYNEKTLVFDQNFTLIYSSIDDATIKWKLSDLQRLKEERQFYRSDGEKDMLGIFYDFDQVEYFLLVAAEDKYGLSKLRYLQYALMITFLMGTGLVWTTTYYVIRRMLEPLDSFTEQITTISARRLNVKLEESASSEEINVLATAFNNMMFRIESSFNVQREFTSNASHELRTPLTRLAFQLENLMKREHHSEATLATLRELTQHVRDLTDLINSLLLLSKMDREDVKQKFSKERIDEVIFSAHQKVKDISPEFELAFEIVESEYHENLMEVYGVRTLLEIALVNLLRNAMQYSSNKKARITVQQVAEHEMVMTVSNQGKTLSHEESERLFQPFMRGANAAHTSGSGLGLRITRRILDYHNASISYHAGGSDENSFVIVFVN